MMKKLNNRQGLTLIEVIVSIAILGIIITPLSSFFSMTIKVNADTKERLVANHVAQKYMEMAKAFPPFDYDDEDPESGLYVEASTISLDETYKYSELEGSISVPTFDDTIDIGSLGLSEGASFQLSIQKDSPNIYRISYLSNSKIITKIDTSPIAVGITCNQDIRLTINVDNGSGRRVNIYKIMENDMNTNLITATLDGEVYTYNNIYDSSVSEENKNIIYNITVNVSKDSISDPLITLIGLKTKE